MVKTEPEIKSPFSRYLQTGNFAEQAFKEVESVMSRLIPSRKLYKSELSEIFHSMRNITDGDDLYLVNNNSLEEQEDYKGIYLTLFNVLSKDKAMASQYFANFPYVQEYILDSIIERLHRKFEISRIKDLIVNTLLRNYPGIITNPVRNSTGNIPFLSCGRSDAATKVIYVTDNKAFEDFKQEIASIGINFQSIRTGDGEDSVIHKTFGNFKLENNEWRMHCYSDNIHFVVDTSSYEDSDRYFLRIMAAGRFNNNFTKERMDKVITLLFEYFTSGELIYDTERPFSIIVRYLFDPAIRNEYTIAYLLFNIERRIKTEIATSNDEQYKSLLNHFKIRIDSFIEDL
jgi:hypothetical protein